MGVLNCDRRGCERIMCANISHTYGYLCSSCKDELIAGGRQDIDSFMGSSPEEDRYSPVWEEEINSEFVSRYDDGGLLND
jgi:hypothetical protein